MKKVIFFALCLLIWVQLQDDTSARYRQEVQLQGGAIIAQNIQEPDTQGIYYPGTTIRIVSSPWPTIADFEQDANKKITVYPSGIFWDPLSDRYYVISKEASVNQQQAEKGPSGVAISWYMAHALTGRILTRADYVLAGTGYDKTQRGDLYYEPIENRYYVFHVGGAWSNPPDIQPTQWYQIPQDTIDMPL